MVKVIKLIRSVNLIKIITFYKFYVTDDIVENAFIKSLNSISLGDIRSKIMDALSKVMTADEYYNVWVGSYEIYPTENYFVYENYEEKESD